MSWKLIAAAVVVVLAIGAGVAFAATRTTASSGTNVCVNNVNGLMRVATACRDGEYPLTIGGGGVQATQNGTFSVPWGETAASKSLPLTGVLLSGRCEVIPPDFGVGVNPRLLIEAASGKTMDVFPAVGPSNPISRTSVLLAPAGGYGGGFANSGSQQVILTSAGATATITVGGYADADTQTCRFLWQAVETAN